MPKLLKRALLLLVVAAMLAASLCACTGGTQSGTGPSAPAQSGELPPESATPTEESEGKNSVTVGIAQDLDTLDPHMAVNAGTSEVLFNLFEGLVKASPDGGVIPAVASGWDVSPDGLTYTFTLREGVTFHNGAPVTVEDVLYSLRRCNGGENDGVPIVSSFILDPATGESLIKSIEPGEGDQVVVTLAEPRLEFPYFLTAAHIIPADSGSTIGSNPIGTGPFSFVSFTPQESLTVKRYDGYWGDPASLDEVTFRIYTGASAVSSMVMALQAGSLDLVIHLPSTYADQVGDCAVLQSTMKLVQALYINNAVEPFDDVRVRQAMYYAIDVPEIIDMVCDGAGVPTGTSMYPAQQRYFLPELAETYTQDIEKAKQLLADAGYPDGFDMTITVPSNYAQHVDTGVIISEQLEAVGINAEVVSVQWETWVSDVYKGRNFETTVSGISASDMTAREMLVRYASDHSKNFINFSDAEYDEVTAKAQTTLDESEQMALYKRAEQILNEQAASLWLQDLCELVAISPELDPDSFTFYCTYVLDMSSVRFK